MTSLFKYFSKLQHANNFLNEGEIFFQSLSHFTACEEAQLQDEQEGALLFRPDDGLKLDLTSGKQIQHPGALISRARNAHRLFIFCTSMACSNSLVQRFKSNYCLEISDLDEFSRRLALKMKDPVQRLRNKKLLKGPVSYVSENAEPGVDHALPERIIFRKQEQFAVEDEYRFSFGLDMNAFDAYNVDYSIGEFEPLPTIPTRPRKLKIGLLSDICKLV